METTEKSFWDKTNDEMTVTDITKLTLGLTIATMALPFVIVGAVSAASSIKEKLQERKLKKSLENAKS